MIVWEYCTIMNFLYFIQEKLIFMFLVFYFKVDFWPEQMFF